MTCSTCGHSAQARAQTQTQPDRDRGQIPVLSLTGWLDSILERLGLGRFGSAIMGLVAAAAVFAAVKLR